MTKTLNIVGRACAFISIMAITFLTLLAFTWGALLITSAS